MTSIFRHFPKALLLSDGVGLVVCFNVAYLIRLGAPASNYLISWNLAWIVTLFLVTFYLLDLYNLSVRFAGLKAPTLSLLGVFLGGGIFGAILYFGGFRELGGLLGRGVAGLGMLMFGGWCAFSRHALGRWERSRRSRMRWLTLCDEEYLRYFWKDYLSWSEKGQLYCLVKQMHEPRGDHREDLPEPVGTWEEFDQWIGQDWNGVIVGLPSKIVPDYLIEQLMQARLQGIRVMDLTDFYERHLHMVPVFHLHDGWFATSHGFDLLHNQVGLHIKGIMDFLLSISMIVLTFPLMALIVLAIRLESRGSAIYRQARTGEGGREFVMYKFRSMRHDAEEGGPQWATLGDPRITLVGSLLRRTRLDELPQVFNVLKREMSFIGPRPERPVFNAELENGIPYYRLRHLLKPGITGWAQVSYPYGASIEDARIKLGYDLFYIKNYSLLLDLKILMETFRVVLHIRGR